jgi:hypothetical protein
LTECPVIGSWAGVPAVVPPPLPETEEAARDLPVRLVAVARAELGWSESRSLAGRVATVIERAAALPAPHAFDRPQEFKAADGTVVASVTTLHEAIELLRRLGRPVLDWTV